MEDNIFYFTKLETVKNNRSDIPELTYEDFCKRILEAIKRDVDNNQVTYDHEKDCYVITYKGVSYDVYYDKEKLSRECERKDVVKKLNLLLLTTNKKKKVMSDEKQAAVEKEKTRKQIIKNGNKGIFYSDEDKEIYIDYLKDKFDNISSVKGIIKENMAKLYDFFEEDRLFDIEAPFAGYITRGMGGLFILAFIVLMFVEIFATIFTGNFISLANSEGTIWNILKWMGIVFGGTSFDYFLGYATRDKKTGKFFNVMLGLSALLTVPALTIKKYVSSRSLRKELQNKIELIKKSIVKPSEKVLAKEEVKEETKEEELEDVLDDSMDQEIMKGFAELNEGILELLDKNPQKLGLSKEILALIGKYKTNTDIDNPIVSRNFYNQVKSLVYRLNSELKKQREVEQSKKEFKTLLAANDALIMDTPEQTKEVVEIPILHAKQK